MSAEVRGREIAVHDGERTGRAFALSVPVESRRASSETASEKVS
jgi:hypothetical protein